MSAHENIGRPSEAATPGRESPSPGITAMALAKKRKRSAMAPPASRASPSLSKVQVLEEDDFEAKMLAIIERDYYPRIKPMQNKIEWMAAQECGDPDAIRSAQRNIAARRAGYMVPLGSSSAGKDETADTPQSSGYGNKTPGWTPSATPSALPEGPVGAIATPQLRLDQFTAVNTSEDQQALEEIVERDNQRKRDKHAWAFRESERANAPLALTTGSHATDGYGTSGQEPATLIGWKHEAKSRLYFPPEKPGGAEYSDSELALRTAGAPPSTVMANTRFPSQRRNESTTAEATGDSGSPSTIPSTASVSASPAMSSLSEAPVAHRTADQQPAPKGATPIGGGPAYSTLASPSPAPGVDGTPIMTWGEIDGTPLRLDEDVQVDDGASGAFVMRRPSKREEAAMAMGRTASRVKAATVAKDAAIKRMIGTPTQRGMGISPAAHKLAKKVRGSSPWLQPDHQLRASYGHGGTPSPRRPPESPGPRGLGELTPTLSGK